ncbi:MAG: hypothetical protein QM791_06655 [Ferruginibacter sp.]
MTFDDFKKQFEIFSKIDTAEKLAICESQYEKNLLHIEDENYFEPTANYLADNMVSLYEKNLNKILCSDAIRENQISFLVRPSFEPEYFLVLEKLQDKFALALTTLTKNYWAVFYADNKVTDIEKKVITAELNTATGDKLFNLLDKPIIQARQPKAGRFVLDGVVYRLSKFSNGQQKTVSKHSPSDNSKSGQIIEVMLYLAGNIESLNDTVLLNIEAKITTVQA